jgi:hypothetical protein
MQGFSILSGIFSGSKRPLSASINSFANPTASGLGFGVDASKYGVKSRSSSA